MKRLLTYFSFIIIAFLFFSCSYIEVFDEKNFIALSTIIDIKFYNEKNHNEYYNDIKNIYLDVSNVSSQFESSASLFSIYTLNKNRILYFEDASEKEVTYIKELLNYSVDIKEKSNGYFNPFVANLSNYWKDIIEASDESLIDSNKIANYLDEINNTTLEITDEYIKLNGDASLDLGAIAKGYATTLAKNYLEEKGCNNYLINAGASNIIYGNKVNNNFKVELSDSYDNISYTLGYIENTNSSITTSSLGHQCFKGSTNYYHHIISPINGYPMNYYTTLNIIGLDPVEADAYSTALFSMQLDDAISFAKDNNIKVLLINSGKILYQSEGIDLVK